MVSLGNSEPKSCYEVQGGDVRCPDEPLGGLEGLLFHLGVVVSNLHRCWDHLFSMIHPLDKRIMVYLCHGDHCMLLGLHYNMWLDWQGTMPLKSLSFRSFQIYQISQGKKRISLQFFSIWNSREDVIQVFIEKFVRKTPMEQRELTLERNIDWGRGRGRGGSIKR